MRLLSITDTTAASHPLMVHKVLAVGPWAGDLNCKTFAVQTGTHQDINAETRLKQGWICEGWSCQEGELLIWLRDSQDKRQLLGGKVRVIQDWVERETISLTVFRFKQMFLQEDILEVFCCHQESLHINIKKTQ